jgi:hypothetical protein
MALRKIAVDLDGSLTNGTEKEFEARGWGKSALMEPFREMIFLIADSVLRRSANEIVKPVNASLKNGLYEDAIGELAHLQRRRKDVEIFVCTSNIRVGEQDKIAIRKALAEKGLRISKVEVKSAKEKCEGVDLLIEDGALASMHAARRGTPVIIPKRSYNKIFGNVLSRINHRIQFVNSSELGSAIERGLRAGN